MTTQQAAEQFKPGDYIASLGSSKFSRVHSVTAGTAAALGSFVPGRESEPCVKIVADGFSMITARGSIFLKS